MTITCPKCGTPKGSWQENRRRGCRGADGNTYCSQECAGVIEISAVPVAELAAVYD